jgi:CubicO group peptidase (beta-lactamase class C family)
MLKRAGDLTAVVAAVLTAGDSPLRPDALNGGQLEGQTNPGQEHSRTDDGKSSDFFPAGTMEARSPTASDWRFGRLDLAKGNTLGSVGQFGWSGAATTTFNIDPKKERHAPICTALAFNQHNIFGNSKPFYASLVE